MFRKAVFITLALFSTIAINAAEPADSAATATTKTITIPSQYVPTFHGTFRGFFEQSTTGGGSRFMVRNARFSAQGKVLPIAEYFFQLDLCDKGKLTILDAYVGVTPFKNFKVIAGQGRVPFSIGASRVPAHYHFANRPSVCKMFGNLRNVGVKVGYTIPTTNLYIEGGAFNGTNMTDHTGWNRSLTYAVKTNYKVGDFLPQLCFMSRLPGGDGVRINQADASLTFENSAWFIEAEYCYRTYTGNSFKASHGYNFEIDYGFPVKSKIVNRWSFQGRFDGITDASNGLRGPEGVLVDNYYAHNRVTIGTTASYVKGRLHCDLRLNYEQYFYSHGRKASSPSDDNKLVTALVLYF